jgi:hypothetical protein
MQVGVFVSRVVPYVPDDSWFYCADRLPGEDVGWVQFAVVGDSDRERVGTFHVDRQSGPYFDSLRDRRVYFRHEVYAWRPLAKAPPPRSY